jgi:hypothetical protein
MTMAHLEARQCFGVFDENLGKSQESLPPCRLARPALTFCLSPAAISRRELPMPFPRPTFFFVACVAALLLTGEAIAAKAKKKPDPAADPPMTVVIVRSMTAGCEPQCPEWIMAEGRITDKSPGVFRKALKQAGKRKLPVVITSSGGSVNGAIEIGRLIRKNALAVAVGRTRYDGCTPAGKSCRPSKSAAYRGEATADRSFCNSACPLILAAGSTRLAGDGAFVGLHQVETQWTQDRITYRETYRIVNGKKKVISRKEIGRKRAKSYTTVGLYKNLRKRLSAYLTEMGVGVRFLDYMEKAPPASIYGLSAKEMAAIGLVTGPGSVAALANAKSCGAKSSPAHCLQTPGS